MLFKSKIPQKPKAIAFVDFEHWYISLDKMFRIRPDIRAWRNELAKKYDLREIYIFADFSNPSLRAEIPKIREVTNYIIETQNASARVTKDFTDFIMLDHIYQKALTTNQIDTFIILSGDGHFSSAASFLINQCGKKVGVYGVRGALSSQLKNTASWSAELPLDTPAAEKNEYYDMIFGHMKYLEANNRGQQKLLPTYRDTVDAVASYHQVTRDKIAETMRQMIDRDYLYQTDEPMGHKTVKVLRVNWELSVREGVYAEETAAKAKKS